MTLLVFHPWRVLLTAVGAAGKKIERARSKPSGNEGILRPSHQPKASKPPENPFGGFRSRCPISTAESSEFFNGPRQRVSAQGALEWLRSRNTNRVLHLAQWDARLSIHGSRLGEKKVAQSHLGGGGGGCASSVEASLLENQGRDMSLSPDGSRRGESECSGEGEGDIDPLRLRRDVIGLLGFGGLWFVGLLLSDRRTVCGCCWSGGGFVDAVG